NCALFRHGEISNVAIQPYMAPLVITLTTGTDKGSAFQT
ncbi:hypothetical protein A2U01_0098048, partial [Trifolium medium]|nr:hypothetical protein [Trifolium medium]